MNHTETLDREAVEGKIKHYRDIVVRYEKKYSTSYDKIATNAPVGTVTSEMEDDLLLVPAKLGKAEDHSEYEEILPTSPP